MSHTFCQNTLCLAAILLVQILFVLDYKVVKIDTLLLLVPRHYLNLLYYNKECRGYCDNVKNLHLYTAAICYI